MRIALIKRGMTRQKDLNCCFKKFNRYSEMLEGMGMHARKNKVRVEKVKYSFCMFEPEIKSMFKIERVPHVFVGERQSALT